MYTNFDPYNFTNFGQYQYPMNPYFMQNQLPFYGLGYNNMTSPVSSVSSSDTTKTPDTVSFKSKETQPTVSARTETDKKGMSASAIIGLGLGTAAVGAACLILHKGSKVLEGNGSIKEKFEAGWRELRGKGSKDVKPKEENAKSQKSVDTNPKEELKTDDNAISKDVNFNNENSVKSFIRNDIKWQEPCYDRIEITNNGSITNYYKDGRCVMIKAKRNDGISTSIRTYDKSGRYVVRQIKGPDGDYKVDYIIDTENGIRTVCCGFPKEGSIDCEVIIRDYNELGQNIRIYQGNPTRNSGKLHRTDIHYNDKDEFCGFTEHFSDGTEWEMTNVRGFYDEFVVCVKSGDKSTSYKGLKNIPLPSGEESSVREGSIIPNPNRHFVPGAGFNI